MITYRLLVSSPFLIISSERAGEWAVLMREFSRLPQMESLLARGVIKTRGRGRGRGGGSNGAGAGGRGVGGPGSGRPKPGAGSIFFLGLGLVSTLTLTLKQRSLKRRDLDSGPSTHIPLRSRGLLLGCSERANTR